MFYNNYRCSTFFQNFYYDNKIRKEAGKNVLKFIEFQERRATFNQKL
jgi:hypothetical protein